MSTKNIINVRHKTKRLFMLCLAFFVCFTQFQLPVQAEAIESNPLAELNLALGKDVTYSGVEGGKTNGNWVYPQFMGEKVVDGIDADTSRWSADKEDEQWLVIDLKEVYKVNQITISFHAESPKYEILISEDGIEYTSIKNITDGSTNGAAVQKVFDMKGASARYVKYAQHAMWTHATNSEKYGSSIKEIYVSEYDENVISPNTLRVGTFNIAATKKPDVDAQRELTDYYKLELLGLQEVDRFTTRNTYDMLEKFKGTVYADSFYSKAITTQNGEYGVGTLSRYPLSDTSTTFLDTTGASEARVFQRSVITKGDRQIAFYNTHISYETPQIREKQFAQLKEALKNDSVPYKVLVGDFNADQYHSEFYTFLESMDMVNGYNDTWYDTFNGTDATMKVNSIDNIIISRNLQIDKAQMVKTSLSDHNMLIAELSFLDAPRVSKEWLRTNIEEAEKIQKANFTPASYEALQMALIAARTVYADGTVQSSVDAAVRTLLDAIENLQTMNLALNKSVTYSGVEGGKLTDGSWKYPQFLGEKVVDGNASVDSRWSADKADAQWLKIDLGSVQNISQVLVYFHASVPDYEIQVSKDDVIFTSVFHESEGTHNETVMKQVHFPMQEARYVKFVQNKMFLHSNGKKYGTSIQELEVYEQFYIEDFTIVNPVEFMSKGEKQTIQTAIMPELAACNPLAYKSSDPNVVSVDDKGIITGKEAGNATITITDPSNIKLSKTMDVQVVDGPIVATKLTFDAESMNISMRDKRYLTYGVYPKNAAVVNEVVWRSSNEKVVTVNEQGVLKAIAQGSATITVQDKHNPDVKGELKVDVAAPAYAESYDLMKDRWLQRVVGNDNMDMSDKDIAAYVKHINTEGEELWKSLHKEENRKVLWDKIESDTVAANYTTQFTKIKKLALAFGVKGTSLYENKELHNDIIDAINFMVVNMKYNGTYSTGNWWDWQIGCTQPLVDTLMIVSDYTDYAKIEPAIKSIEGYAKSPAIQWPNYTATGANRTDIGLSVLGSAIIAKDAVRMNLVKTLVPDVMKLVTTGDGLYADGSVIQHTKHAYTGSYGNELLKGVGRIQSIIAGTEFDITDIRINNVYNTISKGYIPLMHKGQMMSMVNGRSISRAPGTNPFTTEFAAGSETISNIMLFAQFAPEAYSKEYRVAIKNWLKESKEDFDFFGQARDFDALLGAKDILNDANTIGINYAGMRVYGSMDRVVQANKNYTAGLSMYSSRIYNYEYGNTENKRGWHTGDGALYIYNNDLKQYGEGYWPTVDSARLPGTTVDTKALGAGAGAGKLSPQSWVGGASDGLNGVAGMSYNASNLGLGMDLKAQKSWFFLDGKIIALGSGITGTTEASIETTIENRMMDDTNTIRVNGEAWNKETESKDMKAGNYVHFTGTGVGNDLGYVFLEDQKVDLTKETNTGKYADINEYFVNDKTYEKTYFKMGVNHGKNAVNDTYEYVLLPGYTQSEVSKFATSNDIKVIRNDADVQAVRDGQTFAMNVWPEAGASVEGININNSASIFTSMKDGIMTITVSDPKQKNVVLNLYLEHGYQSVISKDDAVTVLADGSFSINTKNSAGAAHTIKVALHVNNSALVTAIDEVKDLSSDDYTSESWAAFKTAYDNAVAVAANVAATQADVDAALHELITAKEALLHNAINKQFLETLISAIETKVGNGDNYKKDDNWATFETVMINAKSIVADKNAVQADVDAAALALAEAFVSIRLLPSEEQLAELNDYVSVADGIDRSNFTNAQLKIIDETTVKVKVMIHDFDEKLFASLQVEMASTLAMIKDNKVEEPAKPVDPVVPSKPETSKPGDINSGLGGVDAIKPIGGDSDNAAKPNTGDYTNWSGMLFALVLSGCGVILIRGKRSKKSAL